MKTLFLAVLLALTATALDAQELSASDLDRRRKQLHDLLQEQWEEGLRRSPEYASILGDKRYNDKSSDLSEAAIRADLARSKTFLKRLQAIETTGFSDQEKINKRLMVQNLSNEIDDARWEDWKMPVTQRSGIHLQAAQIAALLPFTTTKDYDDYAVRMTHFPRQVDDVIERMRKGMAARLMPPKFLLEKVVEQAEGIASLEPEKTPFARPLANFPESVSTADQQRIRTAFVEAIRTHMLPAYKKFAKFVRDEYAPRGRTDVGMWSLPNGRARYATRAKRSTTTNLTPAEIHEIGLGEVARIEGEMLEIARRLGFTDLKSFNAAVEKNPDLKPQTREQILDIYRRHIQAMYAQLPKLFGRLPKANLEVVKMEEFREKTSAAADYNAGAPDGSRPGRININTSDPTTRKTITMESTAYHEGVPGHHMQIAIAQELTGLPQFRRQGGYTAYVEGWALYSEKLGKEVGFYTDPYSDYGRLQDEMLRAIRLVVDTGLHEKKWIRQQVVDYFHDHSAIDEVDVQSETDRYIVWPGQALGYKIGQLKIAELRERARQELGSRFDIRAFHDEVLGAGALPLDVLEERITAWIARSKR